jgi:hypothetical protein
MPEDKNKYIGTDPLVWIGNLRDVNNFSQFPYDARKLIDETLYELACKLETTKGGAVDNNP